MDAKLAEDMQYVEAASNEDGGQAAAIEAALVNLHTHLPGKIISYNKSTQTATCQPLIQRIMRGSGPVDIPQLVDVPVIFPSGGGFVLTFPVKKGDECLLLFSERAIDGWFGTGKSLPPIEARMHDYSDAFAQVGIRSAPNALTGVSDTAVELRQVSGVARISIDEAGTIKLDSTGGAPMSAMVHGILTGQSPCPILGATHGALGGASPLVLARGIT